MPLFSKGRFNLSDDDQGQSFSQKLASLFSQPGQDAGVQTETQPKEEGFGSKLKNFLLGGQQQAQTDEYGLNVPQQRKSGFLQKLATYALPAVYGAVNDVGVLPGLMAGMASDQANKNEMYQNDLNRYQKDRALKQREQYGMNKLDLGEEKLAEEIRHNQNLETNYYPAIANAAKTRASAAMTSAGANATRASVLSDRDKYIDIENRLKYNPESLQPGELDWLEKKRGIYNKQGAIGKTGSAKPPIDFKNL